ncbi:MAG: sulfatase-like hydrolase/transferase [Actinomycetota bacterium]
MAEPEQVETIDIIVSTVVLFVLAVSQPLLDLLGRNAEFFLARAAPTTDIVVLAILLTLGIPLSVGLVILGVRRLHTGAGALLHGAVVAILGGILVLQIISLTPIALMPAWFELLLALAAGGALAYAFYRSDVVRAIARFAGIAPIVVLALFLFWSPTSRLVFAGDEIAQPYRITVESPAPIVLVVFDEFPVASLMDGEGDINPDVYPNFARLGTDGTWFRNAVTVQQQTENSLPAILSGINPGTDRLPTAADHPFTLFTLLADSHDLRVQEAVTDLCPGYACENSARHVPPPGERWGSLVDDLGVVAGHLFLPDDLASDLAPIDATWSNFSQGEGEEDLDITSRFQELVYSSDRRQPIARFVEDAVRGGDEPPFAFLHALVPHVPWTYLPSGQTYSSPDVAPGSRSPGWGDDEWLVDQAYQQHLLQVGYVDTIVGDLIGQLEAAGRYDDTMIVIVADHGIAVRPSVEHRRVVTDETIGDIAAIPLFIKQPHQERGGTDDYRAETVDILPTIADALGIDVPWEMDGTSLLSDERPERMETRIEGTKGTIVFGTDGSEARAVAQRKAEHFGDEGPFWLAPPGYADLLGRSVDHLDVESSGSIAATVQGRSALRDVDIDGPSLPAWINGKISSETGDTGGLVIGIVMNGRVAAITRTSETEDGETAYGAVIPPSFFVNGENDLKLLLVSGSGDERELVRVGILP